MTGEELTELERKWCAAQSAVCNCFNPTPEMWAEFDRLKDEVLKAHKENPHLLFNVKEQSK